MQCRSSARLEPLTRDDGPEGADALEVGKDGALGDVTEHGVPFTHQKGT